jgi:tetratricopeptide (TPR) repeat protein
LARYQIQTGDLAAAARSIDRASEWQSAERGSRSNRELEALNRMQAEVRAEIAHQHYQRREATTAQSHWFRATNLANSITTPSERAQVLSTLARTMNDAQAPTAENYFGRALATLPLITEPSSQTQVLGVVARNLAHAERAAQSQVLFEQAATTVKAIQHPEGRWMAQTILAKHHAEAGDAGYVARILLEQIATERGNPAPPEPNPHYAQALSALALNLAHQGDTATARTEFAAALEQAQRLTDPVRWAETLLYLARDLAAAGDPETAAQLAAVAGTWD